MRAARPNADIWSCCHPFPKLRKNWTYSFVISSVQEWFAKSEIELQKEVPEVFHVKLKFALTYPRFYLPKELSLCCVCWWFSFVKAIADTMGLLSILRKLKSSPDRELRILLLGKSFSVWIKYSIAIIHYSLKCLLEISSSLLKYSWNQFWIFLKSKNYTYCMYVFAKLFPRKTRNSQQSFFREINSESSSLVIKVDFTEFLRTITK